jgi:hypothetical protein
VLVGAGGQDGRISGTSAVKFIILVVIVVFVLIVVVVVGGGINDGRGGRKANGEPGYTGSAKKLTPGGTQLDLPQSKLESNSWKRSSRIPPTNSSVWTNSWTTSSTQAPANRTQRNLRHRFCTSEGTGPGEMGPTILGTKLKTKREEVEEDGERGDEGGNRRRAQEKERENLDQRSRSERTIRWQGHRIQELQE